MKKGYQLVLWFPRWVGFHFGRYDPERTGMAYVYAWHLALGFVEVRKWSELHAPRH